MSDERLIADLVRDEGLVLHFYLDSKGFASIGVGRLIDKRRDGGITQDEAFYLLRNDIARKKEDLDMALPWWRTLSEPRQRVLVNMCFNLGIGNTNPPDGLRGFHKFIAALQRGDYKTATAEMVDSQWHSEVGDRALRLEKIMLDGE